ncbi:MAG: hypothetical protein JST63_09320 [Bacteroidetes bacterium]|nr:hypothetical protein [Bacteroidota bacterium]
MKLSILFLSVRLLHSDVKVQGSNPRYSSEQAQWKLYGSTISGNHIKQ